MGRTPKAGWYKSLNGWYATINGVRHRLADRPEDKKVADRALHKILAQEERARPANDGHTLDWIAHRFLDEIKRTREPETLTQYTRLLKTFCAMHGSMAAISVRPYHVTEWLASQKRWGPTSQFNAVTVAKGLYRWSKKAGYIDVNPIAEMERPQALTRESILTTDQFERILSGVKTRAWKDLLVALHQTGCRPGEISKVTAADVDLEAGTWSVLNKTRRKTTQRRTIYLTPVMVEITRRLASAHPSGPIFRNNRGKNWTHKHMANRFWEIRKKYGFGREATAYSFRHLYITDALERGVPIATVAELVGHTDTKMIMRVYSKLRERTTHLREAASQARPPAPLPDPPSSPPTHDHV